MSTSGTAATSRPRRGHQRARRESRARGRSHGGAGGRAWSPPAPPALGSPTPCRLRGSRERRGGCGSSSCPCRTFWSTKPAPRCPGAPLAMQHQPLVIPSPSQPPLAFPGRGIWDVLALLVFLHFAPGVWEVLALFREGSLQWGLGWVLGWVEALFVSPGQVWAGAGSPPPASPWSGHKSPGRGTGAAGASLGRDNVVLPPWRLSQRFQGSGVRSWESSTS